MIAGFELFEKCVLALFSVFFEGRRPKIGPFNSVSVLKLIQPSKKEKNVLDRLESFEIVLGRSGHFRLLFRVIDVKRVILGYFGVFGFILGYFGLFRVILGYFRSFFPEKSPFDHFIRFQVLALILRWKPCLAQKHLTYRNSSIEACDKNDLSENSVKAHSNQQMGIQKLIGSESCYFGLFTWKVLFWVILVYFGLFWVISGYFWLFWVIFFPEKSRFDHFIRFQVLAFRF